MLFSVSTRAAGHASKIVSVATLPRLFFIQIDLLRIINEPISFIDIKCTDKISISDVNRHKTSLAITICAYKCIAINVHVNF